jgi:putative endonuclease
LVKGFFKTVSIIYYVYVISSNNRSYTYIGLTSNPNRRIEQHNRGYNRTTKPYRPFHTILIEEFATRPQAREREKHLKTGWGRLALKKKIEQYRAGLSASPNGVGDR